MWLSCRQVHTRSKDYAKDGKCLGQLKEQNLRCIATLVSQEECCCMSPVLWQQEASVHRGITNLSPFSLVIYCGYETKQNRIVRISVGQWQSIHLQTVSRWYWKPQCLTDISWLYWSVSLQLYCKQRKTGLVPGNTFSRWKYPGETTTINAVRWYGWYDS